MFWFSFNEENLNKLFDPEIDERTFMEIYMNLYKDCELDPIMTFISEKKLALSGENRNLSFNDQKKVKQMLRGILINKIRNNQINKTEVNNFVNQLNSRINYTEEIPDEEYYFSYMISDKYPKDMKIIMPKFEPKDVFFLFYKYDKLNIFKLGEAFDGINCNIGGINEIAEELFISPSTVKFHVANLLKKTGAGSQRRLKQIVSEYDRFLDESQNKKADNE
jgi:hypothetical protein